MTNIEELDDPYLELFDRINQMALDIKSLEMDLKELKNSLVRNNIPGFVSTVCRSNPPQAEFKFFE